MARPVDEILRDALHGDSLLGAYGVGAFRAYTGQMTVEKIVGLLTIDPTERAALVEHMVASRDGKTTT